MEKAEYIEREKLDKWLLTELASLDGEEDRKFVVERLRTEILTADVVPVRHGRWTPGDMPTYGGYKCSACGENTVHFKANYCPSCGARMDGDA